MAYWRIYMEAMLDKQREIMERESTSIEEAAQVVTQSLRKDGLLYMFGSGHSHLPPEEAYYRSGGLAAISPMLDPSLMFHEGVEKSIVLEKWAGYATRFVVPKYDLKPDDVMMVFSASGRNNAPIEVALAAREKGLFTIGVTSRSYSAAFPSRHSSGKHLADVVDLVIDHDVPPGDNMIRIEGMPELGTTGGASTVLAMIIVNAVLAQVVENFVAAGEEPPMIRCPNAGSEQEALEANAKTFARYRSRLPHL